MLHTCSCPGCVTLTMGELCLEHEPPVLRTFDRGRPFPPRVKLLRTTSTRRALVGKPA